MILRGLVICCGMVAGAFSAQLPEFSQQYVQRMGGAVDALAQVVADFDASASAEGLTRDEALAQMQGASFLERRRADMERTFQRYAIMQEDLERLEGASAVQRVLILGQRRDVDLTREVWSVFQPAVPVTFEGALFAGGGFVAGAGVAGGLGRMLRRRRVA